MQDLLNKITDLENQVSEIKTKLLTHNHSGFLDQRINLYDIFGTVETVSTVPTLTPSTPFDQIKMYKSGSTIGVYIYDVTNKSWRFFGQLVIQPAITAPTGGATVDSQARTAINSIITTLQTLGLTS